MNDDTTGGKPTIKDNPSTGNDKGVDVGDDNRYLTFTEPPLKPTPKDDGTRAVITMIRVDPEDETKCGKDCQCLFGQAPEAILMRERHGVERIVAHRFAACLAAEVKIDEDMVREAKHVLESTDYSFLTRKYARAYRALVTKLKGG